MVCIHLTTIFTFILFSALVLAVPFGDGHQTGLRPRQFGRTSSYAALKKLKGSTHVNSFATPPFSTTIRPTNQNVQRVIEVYFNEIPRYLLLDTGSADTWMISSDFQCLNANYSAVPVSECAFGDPYTGREISQIWNETFFQVYGTGEVLEGIFGYADVTIAGLTVEKQKVSLVSRGYGLGDQVRSGVVGLAPRAVTRLFENTNAGNAPPNGTVTLYSPIFESMYSPANHHQDRIASFFSLALERGDSGGYIAFGGLPPIDFTDDFVFTPFKGVN